MTSILLRYMTCLVPLFLLYWQRPALAEYLTNPQFVEQYDTNEPMLQRNGITGSLDGRVFATTQIGNLWIFSPLSTANEENDEEQNEPVVFSPSSWVDDSGTPLDVSCQSSVVLQESPLGEVLYAVYVVTDSDPTTGDMVQSRVLGVDPNDGELLWFVVLEGSVAIGTPVVGEDFLYVVHNDVATNQGQLSLIQVSLPSYQVTVVETLVSTGAPWAPPSVAAYPQDNDASGWREVVVWGDSIDDGASTQGNLYILKVGEQERVFQTLSNVPGSTPTTPALGRMIRAGNGAYEWKIVTANAAGRIHAWDGVNWNPFLEAAEPSNSLLDPTWLTEATSFTTGRFPLSVAPVLSATETFVFVAGSEGGLAAWGIQRGRSQWEIPTWPHLSQPILHAPETVDNNNPGVLYACDVRGTIRQVLANNRGTMNWQINYCTSNGLVACPSVSASSWISRNGNRLYIANEQGSIFGVRVGSFATPAPTAIVTEAPTISPTTTPTTTPTLAPTLLPTDALSTGSVLTLLPTSDPTTLPTTAEEDDNGTTDKDDSELIETTESPTVSPVSVPASASGSQATVSDEPDSNQLYILLAVVVLALCMCVGGAGVILKRRRKSKEKHEKQIQEEIEAVRRWRSNKKMYEDDIKAEEDATMQELSTSGATNSAMVEVLSTAKETHKDETPPQTPRRGMFFDRRSRSRSRSRTKSSTPGTLGSISESVDEEIASPDAEVEDEGGFEVSLDGLEQFSTSSVARDLNVSFATDDHETSAAPIAPVAQKKDTHIKDAPSDVRELDQTPKEQLSKKEAKAVQATNILQKALKRTPVKSDAEQTTKSRATSPVGKASSRPVSPVENELHDVRPASPIAKLVSGPTPSMEKIISNSRPASPEQVDARSRPSAPVTILSNAVHAIGSQLKLPIPDRATQKKSASSLAKTKTNEIASRRHGTNDELDNDMKSELSGLSEEPGRIGPDVPPPSTSPPDIHSSLSADDDRTDVLSLLSGFSTRSQQTEEPGAIKSAPRKVHYLPSSPCTSDLMSVDSSLYLDDNTAISPMPPADPSPIQQPTPTPPQDSEKMSSKPADRPPPRTLSPPDGASVASPVPSLHSVGSSSSGKYIRASPEVMIPSLSVASEETTRRSNSSEKHATGPSTKVNSRMIRSSPPREDLFTKPVHIEGSTQTKGRTRAGLFSRRDKSNENSSASNQSSSNMSYSEWSESVSAASASEEDLKIIGMASNGARKTMRQTKGSAESANAKSQQGQAGGDSSTWNSFLNQLAKVEEEFFNPTLPKKAPVKAPPKAKRQYGRTTRNAKHPVSAPPPPPPSHTDLYFKRENSELTQESDAQGRTRLL